MEEGEGSAKPGRRTRQELEAILPDRPWVTLTEAATAIAFGRAMDADTYTRDWHEQRQRDEAEYLASVRPAQLAVLAGWPHWGFTSSFPKGSEEIPAVRMHLDALEKRDALREQEKEKLLTSCRSVLYLVAQGKAQARGYCDGRSPLQDIDPATAMSLRTYYFLDVGFDIWSSAEEHQNFTGVRLDRSAIIRWCENVSSCDPTPIATFSLYRTGLQGRPGSYHLVMEEFERRIDQGIVLPTVTGEAKALEAWIISNHPKAARCQAGNIANRIRERHRELFPKGGRGQKNKRPT